MGLGDFVFSTLSQKVAMLAGVEFEEIDDPDEKEVPSSKRLDKMFSEIVILYPAGEELVFRGVLQPFLANAINYCMPSSVAPAFLGISQANLVSAIAIGILFGSIHYFNYEKGGAQVATIASISGSIYGITKEVFGLSASITAHMVHNLFVGSLDKYFPEFLESKKEAEARKNT